MDFDALKGDTLVFLQSVMRLSVYSSQAIDRFILEDEKIRPLMLSGTEWKFLKQLGSILEVNSWYYLNLV